MTTLMITLQRQLFRVGLLMMKTKQQKLVRVG